MTAAAKPDTAQPDAMPAAAAGPPHGNCAARLGSFVTQAQGVPDAVRREATRSLVNMVAAALGGARDAAIDRFVAAIAPLAGPAQATLIGRAERMDIASAAFVNAAMANVLDFDDTHPRTIIHPAAPIGAALLALSEHRAVSGRALLDAFAIGVETACRLGLALAPGHYERGFHITATCGVVGAAAGAARLLGLTAAGAANALGVAATRAGGLVENLGFMAKSVGVGGAARDGLFAALFAESGIDAAPTALEGPRGFLRVLSDAPEEDAILAGLGVRWEALANTYKPYPCGVVLNPVIDAILALRAMARIDPQAVERVRVAGHPLLLARTDRPRVASGREARLSLQHSVAAALLRGAAGLAEYADATVRDPEILALRDKVSGVADPTFPTDAAQIWIELADGRVLERRVAQARGGAARPLSDTELSAKLVDLVRFGASGVDPGPLLDALWTLDAAPDAGAVIRLAAPR